VRSSGGAGGVLRLHPFREERRDDAGQYVTGAGGRESRSPVGRHEHARARRRDEGVGTFQQHDRAEARGRAAHSVETVRVDLASLEAEQAGELTGVRLQLKLGYFCD